MIAFIILTVTPVKGIAVDSIHYLHTARRKSRPDDMGTFMASRCRALFLRGASAQFLCYYRPLGFREALIRVNVCRWEMPYTHPMTPSSRTVHPDIGFLMLIGADTGISHQHAIGYVSVCTAFGRTSRQYSDNATVPTD